MRQQYRCVCDGCDQQIKSKNDENDVTMNTAKFVFCPGCYRDFVAMFDNFLIEHMR